MLKKCGRFEVEVYDDMSGVKIKVYFNNEVDYETVRFNVNEIDDLIYLLKKGKEKIDNRT